jgi:multidrug efflux pump subunit AcrA (membrane-fusion protein)
VSVDESDVAHIAAGDPVSLTVDALPGLSLDGAVGAIETFGETVQGLVRYHVRVDLAGGDPRLYLDMTANTVIVTDVQDAALAVPVNAVQFDNQGEYVNRVRADGTIERIDVVSGQTEGDWVIVTGPLQLGDTVQVKAPEPTLPSRGPFGG